MFGVLHSLRIGRQIHASQRLLIWYYSAAHVAGRTIQPRLRSSFAAIEMLKLGVLERLAHRFAQIRLYFYYLLSKVGTHTRCRCLW